MRFVSLIAGLALFAISSTAQAGAPPVKTFIFNGEDCIVDCQEGATATISVFDFGFGEFFLGLGGAFIDLETIDDFSFSSDSGFFDGFTMDGFSSASGFISGTGIAEDVFIAGTAFVDSLFEPANGNEQELISFEFRTISADSQGIGITPGDGGWSMCITQGQGGTCAIDDIGGAHTFTNASEPGALALLGVGLIGLAAMRRRRQAA